MRLPPVSTAAAAAEGAALQRAAGQFEALFLQRMLAAARPDKSGPAADWRAMADERLAADLAAASPLGIAALLRNREAGNR